MWLPRNDNVLLWMCGCIAAKGTYAEKTFSPEKNNRNEKLKGMWASGREEKLERNVVNHKTQTLIVKLIFVLWLLGEVQGCWDVFVEFRWKNNNKKNSSMRIHRADCRTVSCIQILYLSKITGTTTGLSLSAHLIHILNCGTFIDTYNVYFIYKNIILVIKR